MRSHVVPLSPSLLVAAALIAALPGILGAQIPRPDAASDPAAVRIYKRHMRASGGTTLPKFTHSITETQLGATTTMRIELFSALPDRVRVWTTIDNEFISEFGFDGTSGWSWSEVTGVVPQTGATIDEMRTAIASVGRPRLDSAMRHVSVGRTTFENDTVDGIIAVGATADTVEIFYSVATGLMVGMRTRGGVGAASPGPTVMVFRDYKQFGGRLVHTTLILRAGGTESVANTLYLNHDRLEAARFKPPTLLPR